MKCKDCNSCKENWGGLDGYVCIGAKEPFVISNINMECVEHKEKIKVNNEKFKNYLSLFDCSNLRELIIENPELPLLIFASEESWSGEYGYTTTTASQGSVQYLTLYNDIWYEKDDYEEKLFDDLSWCEEYKSLTDKEYNEMIEQEVAKTEFCKCIVIYV